MECQEDNTFCRAFSQLTMHGSALTSAERFQMSSKSFSNYTDKVYILYRIKLKRKRTNGLFSITQMLSARVCITALVVCGALVKSDI